MSFEKFTATVVKVAGSEEDHDYAGDVQIRIESEQDDKSRLPDDKLRWARMIWPITEAQHKGVGSSGGYLLPGTRVTGYFVDSDGQIPYIDGVLGSVGKYGSLAPSGNNVTRGLPGDGDDAALKLLGNYASRKVLDNKTAKDVVETIDVLSKTIKFKDKIPELFANKESGNGPAKNASLPHLGSKKEPAFVNDMVKYVKSINPKNVGGMISTLESFINLKKKKIGIPSELLGKLPFSQFKIISSIVNMNTSNMLGQLSKMFDGINALKSIGGDTGEFVNSLTSMIPNGSYQSLAINILKKSLDTNSIDFNALSSELSALESVSTNDDLMSKLNQISNDSNISMQKLIEISLIVKNIKTITEDLDEGLVSTTYDSYNQVVIYATQIGNLLNIGAGLIQYASSPTLLLIKIDELISEMI